jgi:uncharacterized membrane protein YccC
VWWTLFFINDRTKVWALLSVIIVSDPNFETTRINSISRVINTMVGCIIGLLCLYVIGINVWSLMVGIILSCIIGIASTTYASSWKLAPNTVVIIIAPSLFEIQAMDAALGVAFKRVAEVMYGSLVAFLVGYIYYKIELWNEHRLGEPRKQTPTDPKAPKEDINAME